tara:strand:+ start:121 stop:1521 length:1401 start_codon:yes stop_codon:yes gene_type:complete
MKLKTTFFILSILISIVSFSQRSKGSSISYQYYRLPIYKVDHKKYHYDIEVSFKKAYEADLAAHEIKSKEIEAEFSEVNAAYNAIKQDMLAAYEADLTKAEEEYQADLTKVEEEYQADLTKAEDEYQQALKEYNDRGIANKLAQRVLLDEDGKPVKRNVSKRNAIKRNVDKPTNKDFAEKMDIKYKSLIGDDNLPKKRYLTPFMPKYIPTEADMTLGISLQGLEKSSNEGLKIKMEVSDFEVRENILKVEGLTKASVTNTSKIYMTVYNSPGEEMFSNSLDIRSSFTSQASSHAEWDNFHNSNNYKRAIIDDQKKALRLKVPKLNDDLNNNFGYVWVKKKSKLYTGTGKNLDYSDLNQALANAKNGLRDMKIDKEGAMSKFMQAIQIWTKALEELDTEDKKARINNKVGAAVHINLALVYTLIGDFDGADQEISAVQSNSDFKGGDIKEAESIRKFMNDQRTRAQN